MSTHDEHKKRETESKDSHDSKKHKQSPHKDKTPKKHTHKSLKDALSHEKVEDVLVYMKTATPILLSSKESLLDALKVKAACLFTICRCW